MSEWSDKDELLWNAMESGRLESSLDGDEQLVKAFHAHQELESLFKLLRQPAEGQSNVEDSGDHPATIGRYQVRRVLGRGAFGVVYFADDPELDRPVAIKVPRPQRFSSEGAAERFLEEAKLAAQLKHPDIVTVHDVGRDGHVCYIVMEYVESRSLQELIAVKPFTPDKAAGLMAQVTDALHYAHTKGFVHRDLKPANILIDDQEHPHITDFGLAVSEDSQRQYAGQVAGTPACMSPEQVRGETHRLDGRSDIWSLGVILYEMLVGRCPFQGRDHAELFDEILHREAKPLREVKPEVPAELERICLKCIEKRISDRYRVTKDLALDLRRWLDSHRNEFVGQRPSEKAKVVPKGLRSFGPEDAYFFLELVPGPRDREGLPDSIRFWKVRIEETDIEHTFSVGLIFGPTGCGKSSLVKAGLLPRLAPHVIPIYIDATAADTELRLLRGLRRHCADIPQNISLPELFESLREGRWTPAGRKILIVLDQFEQWLHAKRGEQDTQLVQALRHCDGTQVQCLFLVRDDFWLATSRFLQALEIDLLEHQNCLLVDLFDTFHARKVLAEFGRAYGRLSESLDELAGDQQDFLDGAVEGLAQDGKVICVRLALFADMMKGKPWTAAALKQVGGIEGLGVTFLEETFSTATAPAAHRLHQNAARNVLKALLPESGADIKGSMRSYKELLEASGYVRRPKHFRDLVRILDSEIRLITPIDPKGLDAAEEDTSEAQAECKFYQLTHDYLVPALREWLTRKQKETRRGRAELRLAERSALWNVKSENRHLPSLLEWASIRTLTDRKKWTEPQRKMMRKARRVHGIRSSIAAVLVVAVILSGITIRNAIEGRRQGLVAQKQEEQNNAEATRLVEGLVQADTSQVKTIINNLSDYRKWANDDLAAAFADSPDDSNAKLHAASAMLSDEDLVLGFLKDRLLTVSPVQFEHVRDLLDDHKAELIDLYWTIATDTQQDQPRRFQAACALATYDPKNEHWQEDEFGEFVADHLVNVLPSELLPWRNALRPVKEHLTDPLAAIYRNDNEGEQERSFATDTLADYLSDDAGQLFDLLADADQKQFSFIFDKLTAYRERAIELGNAEIAKSFPHDASEDDKEALALRQANATVMLLRMDAPDQVWPLLKHTPDPRVRSYIIHSLGPLGGDPRVVIERLKVENDVTIRRALLLCLGEFDETQLPKSERSPLVETLLTVYSTDPDAGLHAASEWLLRQWKQAEQIAAIDTELQQTEEQLQSVQNHQRNWYINGQGQTFVILDAGEFQMGSPEWEARHHPNEALHRRRIGRRFAIATKEVIKAQWRDFAKTVRVWPADQVRTEDSPLLAITWYEAAWYCNWLSEQEGIPEDQWCYQPTDQGEYGPGMKAKENFMELTGYRLPTEQEWEFACRAGATTSRYYGQSDTLLPQYAWYRLNEEDHAWSVASLKPNDFGLFDMLGNLYEWCYDAYGEYPADSEEAIEDAPGTEEVSETLGRVLRGGSFVSNARAVRSAYRFSHQPGLPDDLVGFRVARTYR